MENDNIELPPLPPFCIAPIADEQTIRDYARAAVRADREHRAKQETKPVVREVRIILKPDGGAWFPVGGNYIPTAGEIGVTLRWTADGHAWIESEANRDTAKLLRRYGYYSAANLLDGGER